MAQNFRYGKPDSSSTDFVGEILDNFEALFTSNYGATEPYTDWSDPDTKVGALWFDGTTLKIFNSSHAWVTVSAFPSFSILESSLPTSSGVYLISPGESVFPSGEFNVNTSIVMLGFSPFACQLNVGVGGGITSSHAADYTTGFITMTAGSSTVTGSGTSWDSSHEGWILLPLNGSMEYKVATVASTTQLSLTQPSIDTLTDSYVLRDYSRNLIIRGATIKFNAVETAFYLDGFDTVIFEDVVFDGRAYQGAGIRIEQVRNCIIRNCKFYNLSPAIITGVNDTSNVVETKNKILIENCEFFQAPISITGPDKDCKISGSYFTHSENYAIASTNCNLIVEDCIFERCQKGVQLNKGIVKGNYFINTMDICVYASDNSIIISNYFDDPFNLNNAYIMNPENRYAIFLGSNSVVIGNKFSTLWRTASGEFHDIKVIDGSSNFYIIGNLRG